MRLLIIGARGDGHAKVVLDIFRAAGKGQVVGFVDDDARLHGRLILGVPILGLVREVPELAAQYRIEGVILAIGDNRARQRIVTSVLGARQHFVSALHPSAVIASDVEVGAGVAVAAGAVVNPGTVIGAHAIINTGATIDHDNRIDDYAAVSPGCHLAGRVRLREGAFVGTGAVVVPDVTIGRWSIVGAGAVVIDNVPDGVTVVGNPARVVTRRGMPRTSSSRRRAR